jgi:O-acetylhomoserine (thiol)-lyase
LIDNTFASPYLCRPFEWGADLVFHSATKFIGGHGTVIGGVLVDSGSFDWVASGLYPTLDAPDPAYHDMVFAEEFGVGAFIARARAEGLRDFGACMAADVADAMLRGLETLPVRMQRHVDNARRVSAFLESHDAVTWVAHPDLESHPDHDLARQRLPRGGGAILAFGIEGGRATGARFIESLELFTHLANVGDLRSLVIHPASTTHRQLDDGQLAEAGIGPDLIRLSIGLEDPDDLMADLDRALKRSLR